MADPAPWATVHDVTSRWIASTMAPQDEVVSAYLDDASELIDAEFPDLRARAARAPQVGRRARLVCVRMVMRVLTNPDMVRSVQDTTGPFSGGVTYAAETLSGLYLSDDDRALLRPDPARTQQAFTIDPTPLPRDPGPVLYGRQVLGLPQED